jgi:hypothetical protein
MRGSNELMTPGCKTSMIGNAPAKAIAEPGSQAGD